jgi:hypothetical protein
MKAARETTRVIIPDAAMIPMNGLAVDAWEIKNGEAAWLTGDDVQDGEATLALGGWMRPRPDEDLPVARRYALWLPESLEIPADVTAHTLCAVAGVVRGQADAEMESAERAAGEGDKEGAKLAKAGSGALTRLAAKLDALAVKAEAAERGEVELDRRRSPKTVVLDGQEREVLAASLCACGGVRVTASYTKPCKQLVCARTGCRVGVIYEGRTVAPKACDEAPSVSDAEALAGVKVRRVTR